MTLDLRNVFDRDDDQGQERHGDLPHEAKLHFANLFAHKAGLGPHPGEYTGKAPEIPEDWIGEESDQREKEREDAIDNISQGGTPIIPGESKQSVPMGPMTP